MISKEVKKELYQIVDTLIQEMFKEFKTNIKYSLLNDIEHLKITEKEYDKLNLIIKDHFSKKYSNESKYEGWEFEVDNELCLDITDTELDKYTYTTVKFAGYINEIFDEYKEQHYTGIINYNKGYGEASYDLVLTRRDDVKNVNQGQYQLIYEDDIVKTEVNESSESFEYPLNCDDPFFTNGEFFSKQDKLIKGFLTESEKVAISSTMLLIPFFCKGSYYYLTIDNLTEEITIDAVNTAFKHINRQSNLYYQIISSIPLEIRENYNEFEYHLLKDIRKATGINKRLVNKFYPKHPERLLTSKYFYTVE